MARERMRAAARKALARAASVQEGESHDVARGVFATAQQIAPMVKPGSLYWTAPVQYVCEQMAPRVCKAHSLPLSMADDVAGYLLAGMNEYIVSLVGEFDAEHFEAWIAAQDQQIGRMASGTGSNDS